MSIKRIFVVIAAIFATFAAYADNTSVTSKKYVDDFMTGYQDKVSGLGANKLMIYDNSDEGIGTKDIATSLGSNTSADSVPTVGAVKTGLDGKQDTITGTAGYVMTGTGTAGTVGEKPIYSTMNNYSDALVTAEAVNNGVINAVNNSLIRVDENGAPSNTGTLWQIADDLMAINAKVPYGYTELQYIVFSGRQYIDTGIVLTNPQNIENVINMKFNAESLSTSFQTLTGCMYPTGTPRYGINAYQGQWMIGVDATTSDGVVLDSNQHRLKFVTTSNQQTLYDTDDSVLANYSMSATSLSSNELSLYVGARNQSSGVVANHVRGNIGKTYLKQNGVMLYDYIPAQRDSDNAVGFYDKVSGNFLTHSGLTAGPSCVSPNLFDKNNLTRIYGYFPSSNSSWTYAEAGYSVRIPCKPNTTYTARYNGTGTQAVLSFASTSSDKVPSDGVSVVSVTQSVRQNSPTSSTPITLTTGANDKWLIVAYNVAEPQNTDMANNLQIEKGSTATTYRPYGENICD